MNWFDRWVERFKVVFRKELAEEELNAEIRHHLEREIRENIQKGMTPDEARRRARVDFGGVERTKEQVRNERGARGVDDFLRDVRVALRTFSKRPAFALAAVSLMGLGIGSTTAIFSVVDGVLLRPLPYADSHNLVYFDNGAHSFPDFFAFEERLGAFDGIAALSNSDGSISGEERTVRVAIANVTPGFFPLLGGSAIQGRLFLEEDFQEDARYVVFDHGFWMRAWGGDPGVVGRQVRLDGEPVLVLGVLDPAFHTPEALAHSRVEVWALSRASAVLALTRDFRSLGIIGSLKEGTSLEAAQAEVDALTSSLAQEFPQDFTLSDGSTRSFPLVSLQEATVRDVSGNLLLLLGAVGLLLLVACANVANLFLAQGTSRAGELALRGALGASQGRISCQLLTESAALALIGGGVGILLAFFGVEAFTRFGPENIPRLNEVAVDPRALLFALGVSVVTGVVCGVFPVFQLRRGGASHHLKEGAGRGGSSGGGKGRIRDLLVVAELALSLVLLTGAGLLARSLMERLQVDSGLDSDGLAVFALEVGDSYSNDERVTFAVELDRRLEAVPGILSAAEGWTAPFVFPPESCCWQSRIWAVETGEAEGLPNTTIHPVTPGYFETLGAPMARGREFFEADEEENPFIAVISQSLARRMFGDGDPIGKEIMVGRNGPVTVVGVEAGVHHWALDHEVGEAAYVPYGAWGYWFGLLHVVLRTDLPLSVVAPSIREVIQGLDPDMATDEIVAMDELISRSLATPRLLSALFGAFAVIALLLACGGVYASMLYSVGQRKREMGIRLALGAENGQVVGMVLRDGARLAVFGLGLGLVGAMALSGAFSTLVWGISPTDSGTYMGVSLLLGLSTLAACWIPALKASRTNLVETLKAD